MSVQIDRKLNPSNSDFLIEVLKGSIDRATRAHVLGRNDIVGTAFEDIVIVGGVMTYLTTATTLDITSDSINDTSVGTGAQTIQIDGLDDSFEEISETVTMNGLTIVTTTTSFRRINQVRVLTAGTGLENAGIISIKSGSSTQACIDTGYNLSNDGRFTIPAGQVGISTYVEVDAGSGKEIDFRVQSGSGEGVMRSSHVCKVFENTLVINLPTHIYDEKTDIRIQGKVSTGTASAVAMAHFILVDKTLVPQTVFD